MYYPVYNLYILKILDQSNEVPQACKSPLPKLQTCHGYHKSTMLQPSNQSASVHHLHPMTTTMVRHGVNVCNETRYEVQYIPICNMKFENNDYPPVPSSWHVEHKMELGKHQRNGQCFVVHEHKIHFQLGQDNKIIRKQCITFSESGNSNLPSK